MEACYSIEMTYMKRYGTEGSEPVHSVIKKRGWKEDSTTHKDNKAYSARGVRCWGIYGEIEVDSEVYIIYIAEAKEVGKVQGKGVYEILSGKAICIDGVCSMLVCKLVDEFFSIPGMYVSDADMASIYRKGYKNSTYEEDSIEDSREAQTKIRKVKKTHTARTAHTAHTADATSTDFVFNYIAVSKYKQRHASARLFGVNVVQGYYGHAEITGSISLQCTLLSRRSWRNAGTRYYTRGSDMSGHTANTVETVLVAEHDGVEHVFVQCRGSIPLAWEQKINLAYKPPVKLASTEMSEIVFRKHIDVLRRRYNKYYIVTLLDEHGHEKELNAAYTAALRKEKVGYYNVDYHKVMKNIEKQKEMKNELKKILAKEKDAVIRTNCIDCIDRTNVVQSMLAKMKLVEQLQLVEYTPQRDALDIDDYIDEKEVNKIAQLWKNNADALSVQYTGTSALKTDMTEHGTRTIKGMIKDVISSGKRYVNNNFTDGRMQETIEMMTGVRHEMGNCYRGDIIVVACIIASISILYIAIRMNKKASISTICILCILFYTSMRYTVYLVSPRQISKRKGRGCVQGYDKERI